MHPAAKLFTLFASVTIIAACGASETVSFDQEDGQFDAGIGAGKADGNSFSECELREALAFVNDPATDFDALESAGVHTRAANNIITVKSGLDGELGTFDDVQFGTVQELDDVYYVGPAAFRQLTGHVQPACVGGGETVAAIFSPQPREASHLTKVVELIGRATHSVDIAMYSFRDGEISSALADAVERGVAVRMVFETARADKSDPDGSKSAKLEEIGVDVRWINKIMHHKYAIIDGPRLDLAAASTAALITGSANWSNSAATRYDENTVVLQGQPEAVLRFQREFNLMWDWSRDFEWADLPWTTHIEITDADIADSADYDAVFTSDNFDTKVTSYGPTFSIVSGRNTVADKLVELIEGADTSIHVASGHLRSRPVSEALMARREADPSVDIRVYLDSQEYISAWYHGSQDDKLETCLEGASTDSQKQKCLDKGYLFGYALSLAGVDVRYKYYAYRWHYSYAPQMHNKFLVIDGDTLVSGSYNLSDNAEHNTLENMAIYSGATFAELVSSFEERFELLWGTHRDDSTYTDLLDEIDGATSSFPIVFEAMSLEWEQVTVLKSAIKDNCPGINSESYRKHPESHLYCDL